MATTSAKVGWSSWLSKLLLEKTHFNLFQIEKLNVVDRWNVLECLIAMKNEVAFDCLETISFWSWQRNLWEFVGLFVGFWRIGNMFRPLFFCIYKYFILEEFPLVDRIHFAPTGNMPFGSIDCSSQTIFRSWIGSRSRGKIYTDFEFQQTQQWNCFYSNQLDLKTTYLTLNWEIMIMPLKTLDHEFFGDDYYFACCCFDVFNLHTTIKVQWFFDFCSFYVFHWILIQKYSSVFSSTSTFYSDHLCLSGKFVPSDWFH